MMDWRNQGYSFVFLSLLFGAFFRGLVFVFKTREHTPITSLQILNLQSSQNNLARKGADEITLVMTRTQYWYLLAIAYLYSMQVK